MTIILFKKIIATAFLFLLLFNAFGYYVLLSYQQIQAHEIAIDKVPDSSFKVIKILVSAYAHIEDRDFEYVDGSFFYEGKAYNFVKKRIKNDSLELYCLNNTRQDQLTAQLHNYLKQNVLNSKESDNRTTKQILQSFLKEYIIEPTYTISNLFIDTKKAESIAVFDDKLPIMYIRPPFPPPNIA